VTEVGTHAMPPIGHLTPHSLRRTFATLLADLDVSPRRPRSSSQGSVRAVVCASAHHHPPLRTTISPVM
jgi:integrase